MAHTLQFEQPASTPTFPLSTTTTLSGSSGSPRISDRMMGRHYALAAQIVHRDGQTHFDELVAALTAQPDANVQLEAHAPSDKPKGGEDYNKRLTNRRVKIVADELKKKKFDAARVSDPPTQINPSDCEEVAAGQLSCGDAGANTPGGRRRPQSHRADFHRHEIASMLA